MFSFCQSDFSELGIGEVDDRVERKDEVFIDSIASLMSSEVSVTGDTSFTFYEDG